MQKDVADALIAAAIAAPSGDNAQPWRFQVRENRISVSIDPHADTSLYNYRQRASLFAAGAAVENMSIRASALGYEALVAPVVNDDVVADVVCTPGGAQDALAPYLNDRCSNRRRYDDSLSVEQSQALLAAVEPRPTLLEGDALVIAARAASANERVVLEHRVMHDFLFNHITWSDAEDMRTPGFFIDTLELEGPQKVAFRLFRSWPLMRIANLLGMSRLVARDNAKLYASGGAIAVFTAQNADDRTYFEYGRLVERFWLTATSLGLGLQPLAGLPLLYERFQAGDTADVSHEHVALITEAAKDVLTAAARPNEHFIFMLRVGPAPKARARTRRKPPIVTYS